MAEPRITRRSLVAATAAVAGTGPVLAAEPVDPLISLAARYQAAVATCDGGVEDDAADRLCEIWTDAEEPISLTQATTMAGLLAQLRCLQTSLTMQIGDDGQWMCPQERRWAGSIKQALAFLEGRAAA